MAFTAIYNDQERGAWGVPKTETAYCTDCGEEMYIQSQSKDGRARHFNHYPDGNGSGSRAGGGGVCGGGESDEHKKWKNFAAERLHEVFGDRAVGPASVEEPLAAPYSDKEGRDADACVFFDQWDEQFGRGLAVEVQHKNKDKDKDAVQKDYDRQDVAVVWLTGDDFHDDGLRFGEIDFRHQARQQTSICEMVSCWIKVAPPAYDYESNVPDDRYMSHYEPPERHRNHQYHIYDVLDPRDRDVTVDATILKDWVLPTTAEYWRDHDWEDRFRSSDGDYAANHYRAQAAVTTRPTTLAVEATIPRDWYWPTTAEYWREHDWVAAFRHEQTDRPLDPLRENPNVDIGCTLPPEIVDTLVYQRLDMASLPEAPPGDVDRGERTEIPVLLPASLTDRLPDPGKYACRDCIWMGDDYQILEDGTSGGTAACPECASGIRLNI